MIRFSIFALCLFLYQILPVVAAPQLLSAETLQIRLAFAGDGMAVSWTSPAGGKNSENGAEAEKPRVIYGFSPTSLTSFSIGSSISVVGTFHHVLLSNLPANQKIFYQIVQPELSEILSFTSRQAPGDSTPFKTLIVGDLGLGSNARLKDSDGLHSSSHDADLTIAAMEKQNNQTNFFIHLGDLGYADDWFLDATHRSYEEIWNVWQRRMAPLTSQKAYMVMPGNHEVTCNQVLPKLCSKKTRDFRSFSSRFRMPGPESGGLGGFWYSFDYGLAHFIVLNSETDYPESKSGPGSHLGGKNQGERENQQVEWLRQDLERADARRGEIPWIIVMSHRPFYSSDLKANCQPCRRAFEGLINQHHVDFYLAGHVHYAERMKPLNQTQKMLSATDSSPITYILDRNSLPIHLLNGGAGNIEGQSPKPRVPHPFSASLFLQATYGELTIVDKGQAQWKYFDSKTGELLEEIMAKKVEQ